MRMIHRQLREKHPLLQMIEGCLDFPEDRLSIGEVLRLLEEARAEVRDEQTDMNKLELLRALKTQPRNQLLNVYTTPVDWSGLPLTWFGSIIAQLAAQNQCPRVITSS